MNKCFFIGNLAADPEIRSTASGTSVCNFRIGVSRRFKDSNGETQTDWINIVVWRQLGELCAKYLSKGKKVSVCGSLQIRNYQDKDGNKRVTFEIVAEDVEFLTPKSEQPAMRDVQRNIADVKAFDDVDIEQLPF